MRKRSALGLRLAISHNDYLANAFVFVSVEINPIQTICHFSLQRMVDEEMPNAKWTSILQGLSPA